MDTATARQAFELALEDARVEEEVLFFPYTASPPATVANAEFHAPGEPASVDARSVLSERDAQTMIDRQDRYRVLCWLGLPDAVVAPVLRHELEHVRQWKYGGGKMSFELAAVERDLLDLVGYQALPANGQVYNLVPIELDANGAASRFIRRLLGDERADRYACEVDPGVFRLRPPPEPVETLPTRLMCHGAIWPDEVQEQLGLRVAAPGRFFDQLISGGSALWRKLRNDSTLGELRREVARSIPTAATLAAATTLEAGWAPSKQAILAACDRARELADLPATPR